MIQFLADSSAVWRLQRQPELAEDWSPSLLSGAVGSCQQQRAEFRRLARNTDEFDQMSATAAVRGLVVLHDDADYELAERHLPDVTTRRVVGADR